MRTTSCRCSRRRCELGCCGSAECKRLLYSPTKVRRCAVGSAAVNFSTISQRASPRSWQLGNAVGLLRLEVARWLGLAKKNRGVVHGAAADTAGISGAWHTAAAGARNRSAVVVAAFKVPANETPHLVAAVRAMPRPTYVFLLFCHGGALLAVRLSDEQASFADGSARRNFLLRRCAECARHRRLCPG